MRHWRRRRQATPEGSTYPPETIAEADNESPMPASPPFAADAEWVESKHERDEDGRFSSTGGSASGAESGHHEPVLKSVSERVFTGKPVATQNKLSKLETGATGERVAIAHLKSMGIHDAAPLNAHITNYPIDLSGDHVAVEVKTGLVSNSRSAQQWRATIGQPGKDETEWLKTAPTAEKAAWNAGKRQAIMDRKEAALSKLRDEKGLSPEGKEVAPKTLTTILNPDTKTVDVFLFDGFHHRIPWNSKEAREAYVGTYAYE